MVESIKELRKICQPPSTDRFHIKLARRVAIYFIKLFLYTPITANQVTAISILFTIIAAICFSIGSYYYSIAGALFLILYIIFDCVDGGIARYRRESSPKGFYLDSIGYYIAETIPFIGLVAGAYNTNYTADLFFSIVDFSVILILGLLAIFSILLYHIVIVLRFKTAVAIFLEKSKHFKLPSSKKTLKTMQKSKYKVLKQIGKNVDWIFDISGIITVILITSLIGHPYLTLVFYGATFPVFLIVNIWYQYQVGLSKFLGKFKSGKKK